VPRIDGCAKVCEFLPILAWLFVFKITGFLVRSLLSLILVHTVLNNFIFVHSACLNFYFV